MTSPEKDFFNEQTPSSRVKASIVSEYFPQYCRILLRKPQQEIRYLDLFAGPGKYEDKNHSTPLLIAKSCANDTILSQKVRLIFNDTNKKYSDELEANFYECFPKGIFKLEPIFGNKTVGEDDKIQNYLSKEPVIPNPHPTLLFFDPFGYKTINTLVLAKFLNNWGNEIFLFVNIKRIHAAIENHKFDEYMQTLFPTSIEQLKTDRKYKSSPTERLTLIMDNLAKEFQKAVNVKEKLHHCEFRFQEEDSSATSHYIIHFCKHQSGFELVKQVYHDFDNIGAVLEKDGVYTFDAKKMGESSGLSFGNQNIEALSNLLYEKYKGREVNAYDLFKEHNPTTKYCGSHYLVTLRDMAKRGLLKAIYTDNVDHKVTVLLIDKCILKFT